MDFSTFWIKKTKNIYGHNWFSKKTFLAREILNKKNKQLFCILKNIHLFLIYFFNYVCSWFFDLLISYTNLKLPVRCVNMKFQSFFLFLKKNLIQQPKLLNQTPSTKLVSVSTQLESITDLYFNHLWPSRAPSEPPNHHTYPPDISIFLRRLFSSSSNQNSSTKLP